MCVFFFNDTATTEIYPLALHDALPILGKGIANPLATVSAVAMMLDHLGEEEAAQRVDRAVARCLEQRTVLTADLGGTASTVETGDEAARLIREG